MKIVIEAIGWCFLICLLVPVLACFGGDQIDWRKHNQGDIDEINRVKALRAAAATNCLRTVEYAKQFIQLVPDYSAYVQGLWRTNGPQKLRIRGQKFDRYEITISMDIWLDSNLTNVVNVGVPQFTISEHVDVVLRPDGGSNMRDKPESYRRFSDKDWKSIWSSGGSFKHLGLDLQTNAPVANFKEYWARSIGRASSSY